MDKNNKRIRMAIFVLLLLILTENAIILGMILTM